MVTETWKMRTEKAAVVVMMMMPVCGRVLLSATACLRDGNLDLELGLECNLDLKLEWLELRVYF